MDTSILSSSSAGRAVVAVSSELMKNYASATAVSAEQRFVAAQDSRGEPLLFSISKDRRFIVIRRDPASPTGFSLVDLSSALGADLEAAVFEVSQDRQGYLTLALAVHARGAPERSQLHVSRALSNDPAQNDFSNVGWVHRPAPGDGKITQILMGTADRAQGAPLTLAAVKGAREATHFLINADARDTTWSWKAFPLPENAEEIFDVAVGTVKGNHGVYALYRQGAFQTLTFTSLPDPRYPDKAGARYDFQVPGQARCIAAAPRADGATDLYVAGEGIHVFERSGAKATPVAAPATLGAVDRLLVRGDAESVAVWAVSGGDQLSYLEARRSDLGAFSEPVVLSRGARQIDAFRNQARRTNALFVVRADDELEYHFQDERTTLWRTGAIALPSTGRLLEIDTYTSQISLTDDEGAPLPGARVALRASEWAQVSINGATHVLDADHDVEVAADVHGRITLLCPVSSLSSPSFHARSAALSIDHRFDPAEEVVRSLSDIHTGADFLAREGSDGRPLGHKVDAARRDEAAKALDRLVKLTGSLSGGGAAPGPSMFADAGVEALEPWGMNLSGDAPSYQEGEAALAMVAAPADGPLALALESAPTALIVTPGNLLRALISGAEKAASFFFDVVDGARTLVVKIGEKLLQMAITTVEQAYEVLHWVLKETLRVDLDDLISAFGRVFSWRDIVVTHDVLANLVKQTMLHGESQIGRLEGKVQAFFVDVRARMKALPSLRAAGVDLGGGARSATDRLRAGSPEQENEAKVTAYLNSPSGSFAAYHLTHTRPIEPVMTLAEQDPLRAILADVEEVWGKVEGTLKLLGKDLGEGFLEGRLSIDDLLARLASDAVLGLLDVFEAVIVKLLASARRLVGMARELLDKPIEIPFVSALYERHVGGKMSILGAAALLIAVPVTTVFKLLTGEAPFPFEPVGAPGPAMFAAADASAPPQHSTHPRHDGKAEKPRTYGLETVLAAGLLPLIGGAVGGAGYAVIKILSRIDCINKAILKPLYDLVDRAKILLAPLAPLLAPMMFVIKGVLWLGKSIWLTVKAVQGFKPLDDTLRFARWAIGGLSVLAELISLLDPTEKASSLVRVMGSLLDLLVAIPYAVVRIVGNASGDDKWLIGVDVFELVGGVIDCAATISGVVSKLIDEPTVKAVSGALATVLTVWSIGNTVVISVTPVVLGQLHEAMF